jgi:hypothetical protein
MVSNSRGDCIDRGVRHDPCGPCSVRGVSWIPRERSQWDVTLIGTSLVSQDGRKEQYCVRRLISGGLSACLKANEIHEGMTWGAVARKRTTATGPDQQTMSDRATSCSTVLKRLTPARYDEDTEKKKPSASAQKVRPKRDKNGRKNGRTLLTG